MPLKFPSKVSWKNLYDSNLYNSNFANPNTFCWFPQQKTLYNSNFVWIEKCITRILVIIVHWFFVIHVLIYLYIFFLSRYDNFTRYLYPFSIFQVTSFLWNVSIAVTVGITSDKVKNRLCKLSRVSFLQMTNECLIVFDTSCKLVNSIAWFHQYAELSSHLWSPRF